MELQFQLTYANEEPSVELIDTVFVVQESTPINLGKRLPRSIASCWFCAFAGSLDLDVLARASC
jgi:hypothetical protein